jgi:hypothetical protein
MKSSFGSRTAAMLIASLSLTACAVPGPAAPTVMAMPAKGETFDVFQQHDASCRQYASDQTGGASSQQAAARSGIATAAAGTGIGAAAGALFGSVSGHAGEGAAIGAGSGLLAGSMMGSARARGTSASLQRQYNIAYTQCMAAKGETVEPPEPRPIRYLPSPPPPPVVYVPAPVYAVPAPGIVAAQPFGP